MDKNVTMGPPDETPEEPEVELTVDTEDETEEEYEREEVDAPTSLEEMDPESELWPDGPQVGLVLQWKDEHEGVYVTSLTLDKHVVWRTMTRPEYREMIHTIEDVSQKNNMSPAEVTLFQEEYIADLCVLFSGGPSPAEDIAGLATIISQEVMDASGFVALEIRQL